MLVDVCVDARHGCDGFAGVLARIDRRVEFKVCSSFLKYFFPRLLRLIMCFSGELAYQPFAADYEAGASDVGLWLLTAVPWRSALI